MKILNPIKGVIEYKPYAFQKELINNLMDGGNVIVKAARQMGTSTTLFYCIREFCLRQPNYKAIVVYHDLMDYFNRFTYEDKEIQSKTRTKITYKNGSSIEVAHSLKNKNLQEKHEIFFDLFHLRPEDINPYIKDSVIRCYTSPINSELQINGFKTLTWPWMFHPERDVKWKADQMRYIGEKNFIQENEQKKP